MQSILDLKLDRIMDAVKEVQETDELRAIIERILNPQFDEYKDDFDSSVIACYAFDPVSYVLQVDFQRGSRYHYFGLTHDVVERFMNAESKGSFFSRFIKGQYLSTKVAG